MLNEISEKPNCQKTYSKEELNILLNFLKNVKSKLKNPNNLVIGKDCSFHIRGFGCQGPYIYITINGKEYVAWINENNRIYVSRFTDNYLTVDELAEKINELSA